ncbi:hypothetical protein [Arthrobacter ipis]|uniref:hypothetical protein n=1 Tax=Arthrobacter ipis TaxID=2716202 RepID=UPI001685C8FF|nr:hypothetical protein [Arthrobacter ipis]
MGYTHYFPGLAATADVIADARKIIEASAVTICGPAGQGPPVLNEEDGILLNGFKAAGDAYETFHLRGTKAPPYPDMCTFCTTENRPYDVVVTAILIAAAVRSLDSTTGTIRSDGRWDNWKSGPLQPLPRSTRKVHPETVVSDLCCSHSLTGCWLRQTPPAFSGHFLSSAGPSFENAWTVKDVGD